MIKPITTVIAVAAMLLTGCAGFPTTAEEVKQATPKAPDLAIQSWQTDQGAKVLFVPSEELPILDVRLVMDAGSARDGDAPGVAALTSALIGEGADGLNVDQIARGFEDRGARFSTSSYQDMGVISLRTLSRPRWRDDAVDLLARVIGTPTFPNNNLERVRTRTLQSLKMDQQVPGPQVSKAFQRTLFGQHPYAHPRTGTAESLPGIDRERLQAFYQRYYAAGNAVIALVGDVSRERAENIASQLSEALPQGDAAAELPRAKRHQQRINKHIDFPSNQTHILLGNQATWRGDPDHAALYVGNYILGGGGFASLLTQKVREEKGYVYGVSSRFKPMAAGGPFMLKLQTANDNADQALRLSMTLLRDFIENGPTQTQLENAKANILGSRALTTADNSDIIGQLGAIGFYDLPLDYLQRFNQQVEAVTVDDIREAFQRALEADHLAIVSIGPQAPEPASDDPAAGSQ